MFPSGTSKKKNLEMMSILCHAPHSIHPQLFAKFLHDDRDIFEFLSR